MSEYDKPVETKTLDDVQKDPYGLPAGYYWAEVDLNQEDELQQLYELLKKHYVEDTDGKFRFDYSTKFLAWALNPPDRYANWILGVRAGDSPKLFGFISAIPVNMVVNG